MTSWFRLRVFLIAALVFAADRLTKYLVIRSLAPGRTIGIIPDIFHITTVFNSGTAFGLLKNCTVFFIVFSFAAIALMLLIIFRASRLNMPSTVSLALILGGAAGNLVDRLKFGYVIDFLDFRVWPVFNIADSAITIGVLLAAFSYIRSR